MRRNINLGVNAAAVGGRGDSEPVVAVRCGDYSARCLIWVSNAILLEAPRSLNEPVSCKCSSLR